MESDHGTILTRSTGDVILDNSDCAVESHHFCEPANCVVRRAESLTAAVSQAQILVGIITACVCLVVATAVAMAITYVWIHAALVGVPMPPIPWILTSIASAAFVSGSIAALKIPRKSPVQIGDHHDAR